MGEKEDPREINTQPTHLTAAQLAERWQCSEATLAFWRCTGDPKGPMFIKLGRRVLYPIVEVEAVEHGRLQLATHVKAADAKQV